MKKNELVLIAVYGSLIKGLSNHNIIVNSKYVGVFESKPEFTMISLESFPALINKGNTSITFHVYAVDTDVFDSVNVLEGYRGENKNNFYERGILKTPFGNAFYYYQNKSKLKENNPIVASGNWYDHYTTQYKTY